jgi:hypothetical protein
MLMTAASRVPLVRAVKAVPRAPALGVGRPADFNKKAPAGLSRGKEEGPSADAAGWGADALFSSGTILFPPFVAGFRRQFGTTPAFRRALLVAETAVL